MARSYELDTKAAMESNSGGKRIKEAGAYTGQFTAAWYEVNDKGTESVSFLFKSAQGQEAGPLTLYTHKNTGEELPSFGTFNAILTCLRLRSVSAKPGKVDLYDFASGDMVTKTKEVYPDLAGKDIGIFLRQEEYTNASGELKERLVLLNAYDPVTHLMADEILRKVPAADATGFNRTVEWLGKEPVKRQKGGARPATSHAVADASAGLDDDIPF
jgi:hypothetical protein